MALKVRICGSLSGEELAQVKAAKHWSIKQLKEAIARDLGIPVAEQLLLLPGGLPLEHLNGAELGEVLAGGLSSEKEMPEVLLQRRDPQRLRAFEALQAGSLLEEVKQIYPGCCSDAEIAVYAVQQSIYNWQYVSADMRMSPAVMLEVIQHDRSALLDAPKSLRKNSDFFQKAVRVNVAALEYASDSALLDDAFCLAVVAANWLSIKYLPQKARNNREVGLAAVAQNGHALQFLGSQLRADAEVVRVAVQQNGAALEFAAEEVCQNSEVLLTAIRNNPSALQWASQGLRRSPKFMKSAVQQNGSSLQFAIKAFRNDPEMIKLARNRKQDKQDLEQLQRNSGTNPSPRARVAGVDGRLFVTLTDLLAIAACSKAHRRIREACLALLGSRAGATKRGSGFRGKRSEDPRRGATSNFRFNGRVLGPKSTQEDVFSEVQGLVQSAIDGYNVLLATGGTKFSGKTHTMFGPPFKKPAPGMPKERDWSGLATRVANEIFTIQERDDWRALLEVEMQVVEIRGDRTVDLLGRTSRPDLNDTRSGHLAFAGAMLLGGGGESSFIDGASSRRISDRNEFMRVLNSAFTATEGAYAAPKSPRTPASTVSTARGEPHVVVALHFTRTNRATGAALRSKLMLADLAPMSSPAAGGTIGSTNKEVAAAYHAIEAVIKSSRRDGQAAAQSTARRKHVLGQILRDCLCGNARPVFLMTLNPSPTEKVHTMHAVTFATALGGRSAR
ncbi:unnamed protein product [Durusdinium trenchii]|uniref:Kinesin-like protein n=1 Tax=Durusdinium trenchii TaxID=1381693 RepID=A0ABP0IFV2_9DINO